MSYEELFKERVDIKRKLKSVTFELKHKHYVIKKDGNKLGKRKYHLYIEMYFRMHQLKWDINSQYGLYGNENTGKSFGQNQVEACNFLNKMLQSRKKGVQGVIHVDEMASNIGWRRA